MHVGDYPRVSPIQADRVEKPGQIGMHVNPFRLSYTHFRVYSYRTSGGPIAGLYAGKNGAAFVFRNTTAASSTKKQDFPGPY